MKKAFKFIGVLGMATVLFYACQPKENSNANASSSESSVSEGEMSVAFVYTDSVINKYDFYKKKSEELAEKGKKFEGDLQSRARGFEQEVANFQQTGGNMTVNQQRAKQEELIKKEQNLVTYRDNLMQELSVDEANLYNEVYEKVQAYMKKYAAENDLKVILSYTRGGAVWFASDALDVTQSVIDGLNKEYSQTPADTAK
ncbi:OmpH family outer membrane protein [Algoriphagus sp. CAU 1675]|uniref:OmpH family outer membrane protein n=1 Tax=Algoriphagus sp. CAU 1675 TaxID=3032597 RepID=UPI0023DCB692|nr:OmpH family outer membrane protein [Algoriphagus sp. CAU 1675]MDF2157755.1 OmpH family outer membrane protein [Algoriphagus sp. CAU 1675]